jgi:cephalosporin hydroxylase
VETPVPILQHDSELAWMVDLYREQQPRRVLELGVWHGGTLYHWLREARQDTPVLVVAVDSQITAPDLFRSWAPSNVRLELVEGRSCDPLTIRVVSSFSARFDWLFVDADHHYDCVNADWLAYGPMAETVVFHDVASDVNEDQEVPLFWADLKRAGWRTDEFSDRDAAGAGWGGIGVVYR